MYNENVLSITPYEGTSKDERKIYTALIVTKNAMDK